MLDPRDLVIAGLANMAVRYFDTADWTIGIGRIDARKAPDDPGLVLLRIGKKGDWRGGDLCAGFEITAADHGSVLREEFDPPIPILGGEGIFWDLSLRVSVWATPSRARLGR